MENSKYDIVDLAQKVVKHAEKLKIDYADIRIEASSTASVLRENKKFEDISFGNSFGIGARVIHKGKLGFYSTTNPDPFFAVEQALNLSKISPSKEKIKLKDTKIIKDKFKEFGKDPIANHPIEDNAEFIKEVEKNANISPKLKSIRISHANLFTNYIFASTEGSEILRDGGRTMLYVFMTAKDKGKLEQILFRLGAKDYTVYKNYEEPLKKRAKLAIDLLDAKKPPAGRFNALLDYECTGLFAHEALGHAVEADLILKNQSILKGKIGQKIASDVVNINDDSTIPDDNWSSFKYDNEGVPGKSTTIIKNGVLKSYLHSRETAAKMNAEPTGNARAQNYAYLPIVRMSNTYFDSGDYSFNEMLEQLKNGYYLVGFRGGQVGTLKGTFAFASDYCYRIENGKIREFLKGCTFSGKILDMLKNVLAVEKAKRKFTIGFCGKNNQKVPVSDGSVHMLVKDLHLGGEE